MSEFAKRVHSLIYKHRRGAALIAYAVVTAIAYLFAFLLRFEFRWQPEYSSVIAASLPLLIITRLVCNGALKLSTGRWRFVGVPDVLRLVVATTVGTVVFSILLKLAPLSPAIPQSVILIEWVLNAYLIAGLWISYRTGFEQIRHRRAGYNGSATRVLIVGAGEAGNQLVREMSRIPTGYRPVAFVDDDSTKWATSLHGLEVVGPTADLPAIARATRAEDLIIAIPSASPAELRRIVECCERTDLPFKVLPGIAAVLSGEVRVDQLRDVRIEDLLGREPIKLELPELAEDLHAQSVLITGAAGSIGSELARQVALHQPGRLILLDQAETALFYLEIELRERHPELIVIPVVGDVVDAAGVQRLFVNHSPSRVFHAAAYKHVPIMEANPREALRNNVIGTWRVADAAGQHGADRFVLVSTDKAVRPANIMGATKRLAESIILEIQSRYPATHFCAVRFGNVLGSNGSVLPVFKRQLETGKPLTVTHPDATRYFMTIPEAVQLILQASLLPASRGNIAMLEMGEPVKILDMAKKLLRLSGVGGGNGRRLVFTGLRPGEKLHEELVAPDELATPTSIPKVQIVESNGSLANWSTVAAVESCGEDSQDAVEELLHRLPTLFSQLDRSRDLRDMLAEAGNALRAR